MIQDLLCYLCHQNLEGLKSQETNLSLSENLIEIPIIFEGEADGFLMKMIE